MTSNIKKCFKTLFPIKQKLYHFSDSNFLFMTTFNTKGCYIIVFIFSRMKTCNNDIKNIAAIFFFKIKIYEKKKWKGILCSIMWKSIWFRYFYPFYCIQIRIKWQAIWSFLLFNEVRWKLRTEGCIKNYYIFLLWLFYTKCRKQFSCKLKTL